ncbi:stress-induced protein YchH [Affinibrenneria salicis]|uniref:Stress-induced protein YchH n=1 Tax=Affinibrenneria salicis TaxID=2590031 RepID=A0A5J5G4D1_9GAMM|nr:stress-induced protein YchH [Affinibrenneria salicis]KAA9001911.1 stress-induced protein YchH [Affinibrenneria salicis]
MKRKNAIVLGNVLMGVGMIMMIAGVGYSIVNQFPDLNLPQVLENSALMGIFIGAVLWLAGARIGGRERVADRYWWVKHFDKRCRREHHS